MDRTEKYGRSGLLASASHKFLLFESLQHLSRILSCFHLIESFYNYSVLIDQISRADNAHRDFAVVFLFLPDIVCLDYFQFRVCQQSERKPVLLLEFLVRTYTILAYTQDDSSFFTKLRIQFTESACLLCAPGCHIFRVKVQHDFPTSVFLQ